MQRNLAAFHVISAFAPGRGLALCAGREAALSSRGRAPGASGRPGLPRRTGRALVPRCTLTEEQEAFIFRRSPYHGYRQRRYGSAAPGEEGGHAPSVAKQGEGGDDAGGPHPAAPAQDEASRNVGPLREERGRRRDEPLEADVQDVEATVGRGIEMSAERDEDVSGEGVGERVGGGDRLSKSLQTQEQEGSHGGGVAEARAKGGGEDAGESGVRFGTHEALVQALHSLRGDPLESEGGRVVVHRGAVTARVMIIGEAPGEQEDVEGRPFVGKAGQLLDKIFQYGGFDMERDVYVTNIAKRRPSGNRTPSLKEVEFYMPYLLEEIRLVDPAIIVLAGSLASQAMLGAQVRITKIRGKWYTHGEKEIPMMGVFHPAYLLRRPVGKFDMVKDIEEIRAKYIEVVGDGELGPLGR